MKNMFILLTIAMPILVYSQPYNAESPQKKFYTCYQAERGSMNSTALGSKLGVAIVDGNQIILPGETQPANLQTRGLQLIFSDSNRIYVKRADGIDLTAVCLKLEN